MHGITLHNFLWGVPFELTVHNIGSANSIGNAVFLAADTRYATSRSTFMFHGVAFDRPAGRYVEGMLREMLNGIVNDQRRIVGIIAERTNISEDQAAGFFREAETHTAASAHELGIVHDVREFELPEGEPVITFAFNR